MKFMKHFVVFKVGIGIEINCSPSLLFWICNDFDKNMNHCMRVVQLLVVPFWWTLNLTTFRMTSRTKLKS